MLAWVLCLKLVSPGVETQAWIRPRLGPPARVLVTPVYPQVQRTRSQGGGEAWRLSALSLVSVARHLLGLRQASAVRAEFVPPAEDLDIEAQNRGVPSRWPPAEVSPELPLETNPVGSQALASRDSVCHR